MQRDDDEAWRGIVDNYGDRVELEPDDEPAAPLPSALRWVDDDPEPEPDRWRGEWDDDGFVPPDPPPLAMPPRDRYLAWLGLFGAPLALVVLMLAGVTLPSWTVLLLVLAFVAGFVYLVVRMPREPRDPDDDGAVI